MKRFIVSVLFLSVFFIGIGSIIEKTNAKFKSDAKALELINRARQAIGGDTNLRNVNSMTIIGRTTTYINTPETQDIKGGTLEINMQFPGKFSKMLKIGTPEENAGNDEAHKEVDVIIMRKDGDSNDVTRVDGDNKGVFIIKKGDGTTEEINPDDKKARRVVIEKSNDGSNTWTNDEGKTVVLDKDVHFKHNAYRQNEMLRTTIGLLLTAPEGLDVAYKFLGQGNVDGYPSNIIEVSSNGSSFKLFLDAATSLPQMISFQGKHKMVFFKKENMKDMPKEEIIELKKDSAEPVEHQIRFSDFRTTGGVLLPYRWTETVAGKQHQTVDIMSYEVNPANIADKFNKEKVFVRKMKPTN